MSIFFEITTRETDGPLRLRLLAFPIQQVDAPQVRLARRLIPPTAIAGLRSILSIVKKLVHHVWDGQRACWKQQTIEHDSAGEVGVDIYAIEPAQG